MCATSTCSGRRRSGSSAGGRTAYRLDVGSKAERVLLSGLVVLAVAMAPVSRMGVRGGLHQLLRNFDMAFDEYRLGAGTHPSISLRAGMDG